MHAIKIETRVYVDDRDWVVSATCEPDDVQDIAIDCDGEAIDFDKCDPVTQQHILSKLSDALHRELSELAHEAAERRHDGLRDALLDIAGVHP